MNPRGRPVGDELINAALAGIVAVLAFSLALRSAGSVAAAASGAAQPSTGVASGLRVLAHPSHPDDALGAPGLSALVYWVVLALVLAIAIAATLVVWRTVSTIREKTARDPHRIAGTATRRDVTLAASKPALLRRAQTLRPSLTKPGAADVGYLLGRARGQDVWASVEDSILVLGPPRSG